MYSADAAQIVLGVRSTPCEPLPSLCRFAADRWLGDTLLGRFLQHFGALIGVVTGNDVLARPVQHGELRIFRSAVLGLAELLVQPAAGMEAATGRDVDGARDVAAQDDA